MADKYIPTLDSIKLPSGNVYYLKDKEARERIEQLDGVVRYLGVTTTPLTDGATTNPIIIGGQSVTVEPGNIVLYDPPGDEQHLTLEFIYTEIDGTGVWQEFGKISAENLGAFAYVSQGNVTITPSGNINTTFTGTEGNIDINLTPSGEVSGAFIGAQGSVVTSGIPKGSVTIDNYQPTGSINNSVSINTPTTSINYITNRGSLPTLTVSTIDAAIDISTSEQLNLFYNASLVNWNPGTLPTVSDFDAITSVAVDVDSTFVGESSNISATFTGSSTSFEGSFTPSGSISATFSGTEISTSASYTPSGTISATFVGTSEVYTVYPGSPNP